MKWFIVGNRLYNPNGDFQFESRNIWLLIKFRKRLNDDMKRGEKQTWMPGVDSFKQNSYDPHKWKGIGNVIKKARRNLVLENR